MKDTNSDIFGYSWEQIQAAQQGDSAALRRPRADAPKPVSTQSEDNALFVLHGREGLVALGYWGVLDRLGMIE